MARFSFKIEGVEYRPSRAAAYETGIGRNTLLEHLRDEGYLDGDNSPTEKGNQIGIVDLGEPRYTEEQQAEVYIPTPYFSDAAINHIFNHHKDWIPVPKPKKEKKYKPPKGYTACCQDATDHNCYCPGKVKDSNCKMLSDFKKFLEKRKKEDSNA
jgi:hypothetical protein